MLYLAIHGHKGRLGLAIQEKMKGDSRFVLSSLEEAQVIIDVTTPAGTQSILPHCMKKSIPLVIGTTGHNHQQMELIHDASFQIPLLLASNFAIGIDCLDEFLELLFRRYDQGFVEIIEKHHHLKKDTPSGTALFLKQRILHYSPHSTVTIHSIRHPGEIGEHRLLFTFEEEQIEYTHRALSRKTFAHGALQAALFIAKQSPKYYQMRNVYATHQF